MDRQQLSNISRVQHASKQGCLVAFVGAGVSANSDIPVWSKLIEAMKNELPEELENETDDLKVAQLYKDSRGHKEYMDRVKEVLKYNKAIPNPIHKAILALRPCHIITTNYDDLLEQEILNQCKQFDLIRRDADLPNMLYPNALIKMHGDYACDNIVLSENDYYNYQQNFPLIRSYVLSLFASKLILFIGFSFADLNLKMILNEVQSILSDSMQRVYLISSIRPDQATTRYYEKKGINIIYLDNHEIENLMPSCTSLPEPNICKLKNPMAKLLYKTLIAISEYDNTSKQDFITYFYNKILSYKDEMRVFGYGLKYFLPKELINNCHFDSQGIIIRSKQLKELAEQLKTYKGKKQFFLDHPQLDKGELVRIAYYNSLHKIDDIFILRSMSPRKQKEYFKSSAVDYLYEFDFQTLNEKLSEIEQLEPTCTIADLEYPFILNKLGDYYSAYKEYSRLLPIFWGRQKYILYFISLYNMWSIRNGIYHQLGFSKAIIRDEIYEKIERVDLDEVLSRLPIAEEIRKTLKDLLSFRNLGECSVEAEKLNQEIHRQRQITENGGFSINSNIPLLLNQFRREFLFCNSNFIICDNNSYYTSLSKNTISGILNSFATVTPEHGRGSKIDKIDSFGLFIMVFCIDSKKLQELFSQYGIKDLEFNENAIHLLSKYCSNLDKIDDLPYVDERLFIGRIKNLLYIISRSKDESLNAELIYSLIDANWLYLSKSSFSSDDILSRILCQYEPDVKSARRILDRILETKVELYSFKDSIIQLSSLLAVHEVKLEDFCLTVSKESADYIYPIYPLLINSTQKEFADFCEEGITHFSRYLELIQNNYLPINRVDRMNHFLTDYTYPSERDKIFCSFELAVLRGDIKYSSIHSMIDEYAKKNRMVSFFLDPINFTDEEEVCVTWMLKCNDSVVKKLAKRVVYKRKIKKYLNDGEPTSNARAFLVDCL